MDTTPATPSSNRGLSADAFASLFQSINGLRNRRALTAMLVCLIGGVLIAGLFSMMTGGRSSFMQLLGALIALIAVWTGTNAAGQLLMDQAKGVPSRPLIDALVYGLLCIPKVFVLAIAFLVVTIVVFIAVALIYLLCKIPVLGTLLFGVAFPLTVVVAGITIWGLMICMFLSLPAIWEGAGIMRAIAQSLAIVRQRIVETLLLMSVVWVLSAVIGAIVFSVLGAGLVSTAPLAASILGGGSGSDFGGMMGMLQNLRGGGQVVAGLLGFAVLWAIAATLVSQVYLLGLNLVYLRVTEGLDRGGTERALSKGLDDAKRRAAEMSQKAKEAAERANDRARQATAPASAGTRTAGGAVPSTMPAAFYETPSPAVPAAKAVLACPACHAAVTAEDVFCQSCGHRLK